ncbi:unnamed protein product [Polarella glacialis]|uniref:Nucleotide-diphospho-sugar transferase domain-containing protein n=1 Tax=Polarella glacialis TaxID=89957 RepID=A0A813JVL7_POLGL|nr:unnamed protein product [Polarella glacialis]CAE8685644.1 unnamed protein product [Polarella glacialis]
MLFVFWLLLGVLTQRCTESWACHELFDEESSASGHQFLALCSEATFAAAAAANEGTGLPLEQPELLGCVAASARLMDSALEGDEKCTRCPEGCALVLLLQGATYQYDSVQTCSHSVMFYIRANMYFKDFEPHWTSDLKDNLHALVNSRRGQCAQMRSKELDQESLPLGFDAVSAPVPQGAPGSHLQETSVTRSRAEGSVSKREKSKAILVRRASQSRRLCKQKREEGKIRPKTKDVVAVLIAATPSMLKVYQPFINLWRCYAVRHNLAFILETDDTDVSAPFHRAPNWMRWFAARRYIKFYKALLVVDPDQFVVPECWNISIVELAGSWNSSDLYSQLPDVATRDFGKPQTLNNGMVFIRDSPRGMFFLEQLLLKASWMQTIEKDQGAFDETVLEVLSLEAKARGKEGYDSECAQYIFPNFAGNHEVGRYALCWWRASEELAGPFGARTSQVIRFVDPRIADINHVVGFRGLSDPAILYHFAGRSKDWGEMLATFGLERRNTCDCAKVFEHVDRRALERACVPGGPAVQECEPPEVVC